MDCHYHLFVCVELLMDQNLTIAHTEQTQTAFQKYLGFIISVHIFIKAPMNFLGGINIIPLGGSE